MYLRILFFTVIGLISCTTKVVEDVQPLIIGLDTVEKQIAFLESIGSVDQEVRRADIAAIESYGYESQEHIKTRNTMLAADASNLVKIEAYIRHHGHPEIMVHGEKACMIPWLIAYHAPDDFASKRKNYAFLNKAYRSGDLDVSSLITYMEKMHELKFGQKINWWREFSSSEKLETLKRALDLLAF